MIRERMASDIDGCLRLLRAVYLIDGYPAKWPADPRGWLNPPGLRKAWVAYDMDTGPFSHVPVGHVLVRDDRHGDPTAAELGRLFVHSSGRRRGIAVQLIDRCRSWAAQEGVDLVLELAAIGHSPAMMLYESTGWRLTESVPAEWAGPSGEPVQLHRYRLDVAG